MTRFTKVLLSTLVVTVVAGTLGVGTFASFSAQTDNDATFKSGTIVLSNTANAGTACLSTTAGSTDTNSNTCDALFSMPVQKPGGTAVTADLTLKNVGSLDANGMVFAAACTAADSAESYHGTGDICTVTDLTIQEYTDATRGTPSTCVYGGGTASTCAISSSKTFADFVTNHGSSATGAALGTLTAGVDHFYRITVQLDSAADNTMQGRTASIALKWLATQA